MEGGSSRFLFYSSTTIQTERLFRCVPANNLVERPYPEVLAYRLRGYAGLFHILSYLRHFSFFNQKVGHLPQIVRGRSKLTRKEMESSDTFRYPPEGDDVKNGHPALSAPIGTRGILAEVRATHPLKYVLSPNPAFTKSPSQQGLDDLFATGAAPTITSNKSISLSVAATGRSTGEPMTMGGAGTKSTARVDHLAWIASVRRVGSKRGSSSGGGSRGGERSGAPSRLGSGSRPPSVLDRGVSEIGSRKRSGSLDQDVVERKEGDGNQSLQDECVLPFFLV